MQATSEMLADTLGIRIKPKAIGTGERILVVDDEVEFLRVVGLCLTKAGYKVLGASNGQDALTQMQENAGIDLVLTDILMAPMDGVTLIRKLVQTHPAVKIIASTGAHNVALLEELKIMGVRHFLTKPYVPDQLRFAVRQALDEADLGSTSQSHLISARHA